MIDVYLPSYSSWIDVYLNPLTRSTSASNGRTTRASRKHTTVSSGDPFGGQNGPLLHMRLQEVSIQSGGG